MTGATLSPGRRGVARLLSIFARWYSVPLLLVCWEGAVLSGAIESRLLPGLGAVWHALIHDIASGALPRAAAITMARALAGFALGVVVGIPLAVAMAHSRRFRNLVEPTFFAGYPIPKIALYPIFTFIFGIGTSSKIAFTFLEALYPMVVVTYVGFRGVQASWLWTARNCGASRLRIFRQVMLKAALPSIFSAMRIALPIAITVVVVTEMIGDSAGLGFYITIFSTRFRYANVYAGILTVGLCGLLCDRLLLMAQHRLLHWER